jgi:hypothetical protein
MSDAGNDPRSYVKGRGTEGNNEHRTNFRIHDRRTIECMHRGVVELPPARRNDPRSLKADNVNGTAKLRHGTVENAILSLSFDVFFHDVSIHSPVQPHVYLSIHHPSIYIFKKPVISIISPMEPRLLKPHVLFKFL